MVTVSETGFRNLNHADKGHLVVDSKRPEATLTEGNAFGESGSLSSANRSIINNGALCSLNCASYQSDQQCSLLFAWMIFKFLRIM